MIRFDLIRTSIRGQSGARASFDVPRFLALGAAYTHRLDLHGDPLLAAAPEVAAAVALREAVDLHVAIVRRDGRDSSRDLRPAQDPFGVDHQESDSVIAP